MKKIVEASFTNNLGTVVYDDGTKQQMSYDEYIIMERNYNPSSIAKLTRFIQKKGAFRYAGHDRPLTQVFTNDSYEFFNGKDIVTRSEFYKIMRLLKRYQRFCNYVNEILPKWKTIKRIHWADNSVEDIQINKYGERRVLMRVAPNGDASY